MSQGLRISFFGSSIVSAYRNSTATYYRGIIRALSELGHQITFYEPDLPDRQKHRDIPDPAWAESVVYPAETESDVHRVLHEARGSDLIIKASNIGVFDDLLDAAVLGLRRPGTRVAYWDVDAAATLNRLAENGDEALHHCIPEYDLVLTYGGGDAIVQAYTHLGAHQCVPIHNALDPTTHFPVQPDSRFHGTLGFLANRLPDREARADAFFFEPAVRLPYSCFLLGGSGWEDKPLPGNVRRIGHVRTWDHNAFNCTPRAILSISCESTARCGFSPACRIFEAAGAGACVITDPFTGVEQFLEPGREIPVAASGADVVEYLRTLSYRQACRVGERARRRILAEHTYAHRARQLHTVLTGAKARNGAEMATV